MAATQEILPLVTDDEIAAMELAYLDNAYGVTETFVAEPPKNLPKGWTAYNPSAPMTIPEGEPGAGRTVIYLRTEPDRSNKKTSHLGITQSEPHFIDLENLEAAPEPFPEAKTILGEDPQLTRLNRLNENGEIEKVWVLSVVSVEPDPYKANVVKSLRTKFYWGRTLGELEFFAEGPEGEKDVRIVQAGDPETSVAIHLYGRYQPKSGSGSPTYAYLSEGLQAINEKVIDGAPFLRDKYGNEMFPIGGGTWGGVNGIVRLDDERNLLIVHRAQDNNAGKKDANGKPLIKDLEYVTEAWIHNHKTGQIQYAGILTEASDYKPGEAKKDSNAKTGNVTFAGGPLDGKMDIISLGLRDHNLAFAKLTKVARRVTGRDVGVEFIQEQPEEEIAA